MVPTLVSSPGTITCFSDTSADSHDTVIGLHSMFSLGHGFTVAPKVALEPLVAFGP